MNLETFFERLEATRTFKPHISTDGIVRIFLFHWGMNPITAVAVKTGHTGRYSTDEISNSTLAARCLDLSDKDRNAILSASSNEDDPLRPRLLQALGLDQPTGPLQS